MAIGSLNLKVSKEDFERRIELIDARMTALLDVVERYNRAKQNVDQFMESDDSNVEAVLERIDVNITTAKKSYTLLNETKISMQETVNQMENLGKEIKETFEEGTEAAKNVVEAAVKVSALL